MSAARAFLLVAVFGAAACGDAEPPASEAAAPAVGQPAAELPAAPADSTAELPPGLAPVAIDGDLPPRTERQPAAPSQPTQSEPAPAPAAATEEPPARQDDGAAILRRASAAYADVRSMQADFVMHFNNPLLRQQTTSRGTLHQQRPDRIALRFTDPAGDVILSDGEHFYVYQPSIDARQATRTPAAASGGGGGVDLQAQFVGNPTERFRYTLEGEESVGGRAADVMALVPRQRAEYRSLKVWFDRQDALARRFEITEHNGSVRRFDLSNLRVNVAVPASVFRFSPPADVRIVNVG